MNIFCSCQLDIDWLFDTHLKDAGDIVPTKENIGSFIIYGHEDSPTKIDLYQSDAPTINDNFIQVHFDDNGISMVSGTL